MSDNTYGKGDIAARYATDDGERTSLLDRARLCAALTKPSVLPPRGQTPSMPLPEAYQSLGAWGLGNLTAAMHTALFPPFAPWFQFTLTPKILYSKQVSDEKKQKFLDEFFMHQLIAQGMLDSSHLDDKDRGNRRPRGFWTTKNASLLQLNITGDTLEYLTDDYRLKMFRRDQYVTFRDSCGDVMYHITKESVDPLGALNEKQLELIGLKKLDEQARSPRERMQDLFTAIDWQPWTKTWVIRQEVRGHVVNESQETVTPYFSTPYDLNGMEHYGRGFVESVMGDLRSLNNIEMRILDFAAMCSTLFGCPDQGCEVNREDLKQPSGSIVEGFRVAQGQIQDFGWLKVDKYPDFQVVHETAKRKYEALSRAMNIESEITPSKERTTATQVNRIAAQVQGATGGMYAAIADEQQDPLIRRVVFQCRKDGHIPKLPDKTAQLEILTGLAALARQSKLGTILQFVDVVTRLGPELQKRLNSEVIIDVLARYSNLYEPGLTKDEEQMDAENRKAVANEAHLAAANKAADVVGNITEAALTKDATGAS